MKDIREIVRFWEARRVEPLALATLVAASGSSYRRPGARMLIDLAGAFAGSVSAGCIEEEVITCARAVLRSGTPRLMTFDTRRRFGCHGTIDVFVEPVADQCMEELGKALAQRQRCCLETIISGDSPGTRLTGYAGAGGGFVQVIEPVLRLVVIGDGSDAIALRAQALLLGWDVLQCETAPSAQAAVDDRTAAVVATHNFGRDCVVLRDLLPTELRYLGLIGSRRRRDDLLFDVLHNGIETNCSLFAPAGLHLGADSPEEIALSIVAEIQCVFGVGNGRSLRTHQAPIHQPAPELLRCAGSAA